jgi:hypothetical protein
MYQTGICDYVVSGSLTFFIYRIVQVAAGLFFWDGDALALKLVVKDRRGVEGGLYSPPPNPIGLRSDTRTVLGQSLDFARTFFGWNSCQIKMSSPS